MCMTGQFTCQGRVHTRREIPGEPVTVTRRQSESAYCPTVSTVWTGLHILSDGETEITVEQSIVTNAGKWGTSLSYVKTLKYPSAALNRTLAGMGWKIK